MELPDAIAEALRVHRICWMPTNEIISEWCYQVFGDDSDAHYDIISKFSEAVLNEELSSVQGNTRPA